MGDGKISKKNIAIYLQFYDLLANLGHNIYT